MASENNLVTINKHVFAAAIGIILMLAIIGGALLLTKDNNSNNNSASNTTTDQQASAESTEETEESATEPIKVAQTDKGDSQMELMSYELQESTLILNLAYQCTNCDDEEISESTIWKNPAYPDKLKDAYVVDNASSQRYNVVVDEDDNPLVSDGIGNTLYFSRTSRQRVNFYVTITPPERGSTVDIYIPGAQPITNITLE